jgi:hypothetical protein
MVIIIKREIFLGGEKNGYLRLQKRNRRNQRKEITEQVRRK